MQELIDKINHVFRNNKIYHVTHAVNDIIEIINNEGIEKEKKQIKILIDALERIRDWDDEMHSEWDDPGEFASFTLKNIN